MTQMCTSHRYLYLRGLLLLLLLSSTFGCNESGVVVVADPAPIIYDGNLRSTVCDPFANNSTYAGGGYDQGIVSKLHYLRDDQPRYSNTFDYSEFGEQLEATLFFSDLNVPTRKFDLGFTTLSGETLVNNKGNTLYEYFALHFESQISLTENQQEGPYQFALLSDDGSVMSADTGSGFQVIVDNNGQHPTQFKVATAPVQLRRGQPLPIQVDYNQGPRFHIALVLMWRPWPQTGGSDPANGVGGNSIYFDYNVVPSTQKQAYKDLLARGWSPVPASNFKLPQSVASNPCVSAQPSTVPGVSAFCAQDSFVGKGPIRVGLASDPNEGSSSGTLWGLSVMGYPATLYTPADVEAGRPAQDGINVLVMSRVAAVAPTGSAFSQAVRDFIQGGGSVVAEYDGAALFFDQVGSGDAFALSQLNPMLNLYSGVTSGGGLLVPVSTSLLTVTDSTDAIMAGVPMSYLRGNKAAFGVSGYNSEWLHTSATFSSVGASGWGPSAVYPAVLSGRCNKGRVALFTMSLLNSVDDTPVQSMFGNAIRWVAGQ